MFRLGYTSDINFKRKNSMESPFYEFEQSLNDYGAQIQLLKRREEWYRTHLQKIIDIGSREVIGVADEALALAPSDQTKGKHE